MPITTYCDITPSPFSQKKAWLLRTANSMTSSIGLAIQRQPSQSKSSFFQKVPPPPCRWHHFRHLLTFCIKNQGLSLTPLLMTHFGDFRPPPCRWRVCPVNDRGGKQRYWIYDECLFFQVPPLCYQLPCVWFGPQILEICLSFPPPYNVAPLQVTGMNSVDILGLSIAIQYPLSAQTKH